MRTFRKTDLMSKSIYPKLNYVVLILWLNSMSGELVVNVKNQGGEVFQESIWANVSEETVHLQLQQPDGTIITQLIDFKNDIQIINALTLGEEEQKESQFQILCFVTRFKRTEFIPPDAMAKLRQKNPWAVRTPEKDLGKLNTTLDVLLDITITDWISPHIKSICWDAKDATYAIKDELEAILTSKSTNNLNLKNDQDSAAVGGVGTSSVEANEMYLRAVKPFPITNLQDCLVPLKKDSSKMSNLSCVCPLELCISWYPCALKYCRGRESPSLNGNPPKSTSYRCGIHTCKLCRRYSYSVPRSSSCLSKN